MTYPDEFQAIRFFSVHTNANHPRAQLSVRLQGSKQAFNETNLYPFFLKSTLNTQQVSEKAALLQLLQSEAVSQEFWAVSYLSG